ncbi:MAG: PLP-dependent aminotransferase family protein [Chitinophagaceae bacterium]|nr:PLP-dependent aminotransferase family protein [Chitinophagaceae bacterium]
MNTTNAGTHTDHDFLYLQVADRLEKQIGQGVLKTGDKLLSVRSLSREQGISISTAFNAYTHLEIRGLIEARPKSGYYVRFTPTQYPEPLLVEKPANEGREVSTDEMIALVYKAMSDEGVVRLSLAGPSVDLLPKARLTKALIEAIRESSNSCINYEQLQGDQRLRQQVAKLAFNWGGNVQGDDIITTQGCMEALVFCLKAVTKPGDTVAIESPTYFSIFNVMQSLGLKVVEIPTDPVTGLDISFLSEAIKRTKITACLFVPNFNNPTGSCMPDENKKRLVNLLTKHKIPLVEDDIYGELYFGRNRPRTCKSYDKNGWVLLCSSISKTLSPGYRVGWCIPGKYKAEVLKLKLMHTVSSATPTQAAIGMFFSKGRFDLHLRHLRKALYTQCLQHMKAISDYFPADTCVTVPQGGYVFWIKLNRKVNAFQLFKKAMEENISIAPGQIFTTDARFRNYIRLSFGQPYDKKIERSMKILGRLIKEIIEN